MLTGKNKIQFEKWYLEGEEKWLLDDFYQRGDCKLNNLVYVQFFKSLNVNVSPTIKAIEKADEIINNK